MAVQITTNPTNGGNVQVDAAGCMTVQVMINAAATVNTWMVPTGATTPITPGQGSPQPPPNVWTPYIFCPVPHPAAGNKYDVTVQANNTQGLVTLTITVTAA